MNVYLASVLYNINLLTRGGLAGGITGNVRECFVKAIKVYLANSLSKKVIQEGNELNRLNILESYYYIRKCENLMLFVKHFGSFLLDSGAFTFLSGSHKGGVNWDKYVEEYAAFINKWDIDLFFELDIDSVVGLAEVERLRDKLEALTCKKPIPVWHRNRGRDYFVKMCENYPYVALGGVVIKEIERKKYESAFPWFIKTAHHYGCKIHGLGYTPVEKLKMYHFDSVDSTAWLCGNYSGYILRFLPQIGNFEKIRKTGCRVKTYMCTVNNFNEWIKFSEWAKNNL